MTNLSSEIKSLITHAIIYAVLGVGCIILAKEALSGVWYDALLIIGGISLGGFCAMMTMLNIRLDEEKERRSKEESK